MGNNHQQKIGIKLMQMWTPDDNDGDTSEQRGYSKARTEVWERRQGSEVLHGGSIPRHRCT